MNSLFEFGLIIRDFLLSFIGNITPLTYGSSPAGLAYIGETFCLATLCGLLVILPLVVFYKAIKVLFLVRYND